MDKFNSRAGINPKNTSDNLFSTSELELYDDEYDAVDDAVTANVEQASTTAPQKTPKSSTRKSKKSKTNHHQTDSLDYLLTSIARGELEKQKKQSKDNSIAQKVELAEQFKRMSDALGGSKIKAAYHCKEFAVLLDKKEKDELKKYADEQESDSDSD